MEWQIDETNQNGKSVSQQPIKVDNGFSNPDSDARFDALHGISKRCGSERQRRGSRASKRLRWVVDVSGGLAGKLID